MRKIVIAALVSAALTACGDNLEDAGPELPAVSSCDELADAVPADDVGECLVAGTDFIVAGVSYRAADGSHTWVQSVQWHGGETGVVTRGINSTVCVWRPCQFERTPATGEP